MANYLVLFVIFVATTSRILMYIHGTQTFLQPTGIGHIFFSMQNLWDMQIFKMNKIKRDCEKCHYI